jgi:dienelactone hydrolase
MKRLLPVLMGFVFLLLSSTEGWSLPPCPEKGVWNNCFGTYTTDDGTKYVGEWKNDQSHGQGTEIYANGDKYVGEWKDGKKNGQGIQYHGDGTVDKEGIFKGGKFQADLKPLPSSGKRKAKLGQSNQMPVTIYIPEGTGAKPLILVIHTSGGLRQGEHDYAMALQKEGFLSVVPDFYAPYGLSQPQKKLTWTKYREDIHNDFTAIISQLKSMSKEPIKKVFAVGFSNGGYWAAALAARGDIDAGVSYYGAYSEGGTLRGRGALKKGSILSNTSSKSAPVLMFHGTEDSYVPFKWVAKKFERLYPDIEAHYYDGVDHAYDKKKKGGRYYNEEATKDSWIKTLEFLRKHGA